MRSVVPLLLLLVSTVVATDLSSKKLAEAWLSTSDIELLPNVALVLGYNTGISFGLFAGNEPGLMLLVTSAALAFMALAAAMIAGRLERVGLGLIIGGGLGNLIDRAMDGAVTDFVSLTVWNWRFPTFNLADLAITVGAALLIVSFGMHRGPKQVSR